VGEEFKGMTTVGEEIGEMSAIGEEFGEPTSGGRKLVEEYSAIPPRFSSGLVRRNDKE